MLSILANKQNTPTHQKYFKYFDVIIEENAVKNYTSTRISFFLSITMERISKTSVSVDLLMLGDQLKGAYTFND